ncbi:M14 family zinc carboxypeptidase [Mucisphaera sp.]|uniref:M14 family zinc carboxypeptidase n=1 Tax=Mucisphaera sp. TaxID=2913024 RepID=UPI003D14D78E
MKTTIAAFAATLALTAASHAITLDADFDHGSLESWSVTGSTVSLVGRDNYYGGDRWRWLHFKASDVQSVRPDFRISSNFAGGASRLDGHSMVYSYDQENWHYFDNGFRSRGGGYTFFNDNPFTQNDVYVAYAFPYSYGRSQAHSQKVLESPWAEPTLSADENGVLGLSPGGIDDLGRTINPREIYAYRITNPATDSRRVPKKKIVVMTGMHAGETLGRLTYEAFIDWMISDDPVAAKLRDIAEVFAYPTTNPDGVFAGNNRATVQNPNTEPNGRWSPDNWIGHDDIRINGEAMQVDITATPGETVDYFIDFHSTIPAFPGDDFGFIEEDQGDDLSPFWQSLLTIQPNILQTDSSSTNWTSANFAEFFLNAEVDVTFETMFGFERPIAYYEEMGKNFGLAFAQGYGIEIPEPTSALLLAGLLAVSRRSSPTSLLTADNEQGKQKNI